MNRLVWPWLAVAATPPTVCLIPLSDATRGHGTHPMAAVWKSYLAEFIQTLP